jgi:hypothetical protein
MKKIHVDLMPTYIGLFVWHLRCLYELKIVNPFWFVYPLPQDPHARVWAVIGLYVIGLIYYVWHKTKERFLVVPLYVFVSTIYLIIFNFYK